MVPPRLRIISDGKNTEKDAKQDLGQNPQTNFLNGYSNTTQGEPQHNISYYMRMARSLTPKRHTEKETKEGLVQSKTKCWAFGSSTPREFSHLNRIKPELRVYDAKMIIPPEERSQTMPSLAQFHPKPAPQKLAPKPKLETSNSSEVKLKSKIKSRKTADNDEIASEPDMVQDRGQDFEEYLRQYQAAASSTNGVRNKNGSNSSTPTPEPSKPDVMVYKKTQVESFLNDLNSQAQEPIPVEQKLVEEEKKSAEDDHRSNSLQTTESIESQENSINFQEKEHANIVVVSDSDVSDTMNQSEQNIHEEDIEKIFFAHTTKNDISNSEEFGEKLELGVLPQMVDSPRQSTIVSEEIDRDENIINNQEKEQLEFDTLRKIHYKNGQQNSENETLIEESDHQPPNEHSKSPEEELPVVEVGSLNFNNLHAE